MTLNYQIFCRSKIASAAPEKCVEGHSYEVDCNTCTCTPTGIYVCTRRQCYEGPQFPDTVTQAIQPARKRRDEAAVTGCDKGPSYNDGCNSCTCSTTGIYACTKKQCFEGPEFPDTVTQAIRPARKRRDEASVTECDKGPSYNDGCNSCTCTKSGTYACTRRLCYEGPEFPDTVTQAIQPAKQKREIDAGAAKSDMARATNQNFLRFDAERCTPGEVKNEVI